MTSEELPDNLGQKHIMLMTRTELRSELHLLRKLLNEMAPVHDDKLLQDMTEPELREHLSHQLQYLKCCQTEDTVGSMLIIFGQNKITQYGATVDPETAPQALRELADRIENRETVKR